MAASPFTVGEGLCLSNDDSTKELVRVLLVLLFIALCIPFLRTTTIYNGGHNLRVYKVLRDFVARMDRICSVPQGLHRNI